MSERSEVASAPRTAGEMLARAKEFLARKEIPHARLDAELLVAHALGLSRLQLFLQLERPVTAAEIAGARELLVRRGRREPVAYITGSREFYGRAFAVDRNVLVPRPETELLVDIARERAKARGGFDRIADVGTGSGCIAITLALELAGSRVHAVDLSGPALAVARKNAASLGATVEFVDGDGPAALNPFAPFDLLASNPPYIAPEDRASLAPEVRDFEPELALFTPPNDPQHWIRRLLDEGMPLLAERGLALVELGHDQAPGALELARARGFEARTRADYEGIERVLEITR